MPQKIKVTANEALNEVCPTCSAPVGMACVYVHPKEWTYENQHRFFNSMPLERQLAILKRSGDYIKSPHNSRFEVVRKAKREAWEQGKLYLDSTVRDFVDEIPQFSWNYTKDLFGTLTVNSVQYVPEAWMDEARQKGYKQGMEEGIREGLRQAIRHLDEGINNL